MFLHALDFLWFCANWFATRIGFVCFYFFSYGEPVLCDLLEVSPRRNATETHTHTHTQTKHETNEQRIKHKNVKRTKKVRSMDTKDALGVMKADGNPVPQQPW